MATYFDFIAKAELGSTTSMAYAAFTSIPQTYTDLKLVASIRSDRSSADTLERLYVTFNSSSTNAITMTNLAQQGSSVYSDQYTTANSVGGTIGLHHNTNATAGVFGLSELYIHNYSSTSLQKMSSSNSTGAEPSYTYQFLQAYLWADTSAISSIYINGLGSNLLAYSNFYLYGIKNS